jgi:hypothetical protein
MSVNPMQQDATTDPEVMSLEAVRAELTAY